MEIQGFQQGPDVQVEQQSRYAPLSPLCVGVHGSSRWGFQKKPRGTGLHMALGLCVGCDFCILFVSARTFAASG